MQTTIRLAMLCSLLAPLTTLTVACETSQSPARGQGGGIHAEGEVDTREGDVDGGGFEDVGPGICDPSSATFACDCFDRSLRCDAMSSLVKLDHSLLGAMHWQRGTCLPVSYDPALASERDAIEAALREASPGCSTLRFCALEERADAPSSCERRIHFSRPGACEASTRVNGYTGLASGACITATETGVRLAHLLRTLGFEPLAREDGAARVSVLQDGEDLATVAHLFDADREGLCAAYGEGGACR